VGPGPDVQCVTLGVAIAALGACRHDPGSLYVSGTGGDAYYVADETGQKALTGSRNTNTATDLAPGKYTVVLNGSRAPVTIRSQQRTEVPAGDLLVAGIGRDAYYVADQTGQTALTGSRNTNVATELLPGTYTVVLNGSRAQVAVTAGPKTQLNAGNLLVSGTGRDAYFVADQGGQTALTGSRNTNVATELLAGTYTVVLNGSRATVAVTPGLKTEVGAGNLLVVGTGRDAYYVADQTGQTALTGSRNTNVATELLAGTYTLVLNGSRARVSVPGAGTTEARAANLMVSGSGSGSYYVSDATDQTVLTGSRSLNTAMELLQGTYVVHAGERRVTVSLVSGRAFTVRH
jgi:hypothetical protein